MIICTRCKYRNEDDDEFCGSCGKLLEWVGEQVLTPVEVPVEVAEVEPERARPGIITRVKAAVGIDDDASAPPASGTAAAASAPLEPTAVSEEAGAESPAQAEEEEARLAAETGARRAAAADEARLAAEAEAARQAAAEEQARRAAEAEEQRRAAAEEQAARLAAEAAETARIAEEARREAGRQAAEQADQQQVAAQRAAQAEEAARRGAEEARVAAEAEQERRVAADEEARLAAEAEDARRAAAEAEARLAAEEDAKQRAEEEARRIALAKLLARPQTRAVPSKAASPAAAPPAGPSTKTPNTPATPSVPVEPVPTSTPARAYEPEKVAPAPPRPVPASAADERGIREGDLVCGKCGRGNDPDRRFCRKCGESLLEAEIAKPPPWWKRIFRRRQRVYKAGERPGRSTRGSAQGVRRGAGSVSSALRRVLLLLAVAGLALPIAVPSVRRVVGEKITAVRKLVLPRYENVQPVKVEATSFSAGHEPFLMIDRTKNTFWSEDVAGDGAGERITFRFDGKADLDKIVIRSGAFDPNDPGLFESKPRPAGIQIVLDNGKTFDLTVRNEPDDQVFSLKGAKEVASLQLVVVAVHKSAGGSDMSISQVEFQKVT